MTGRPREQVSLYGGAGQRFREIKEEMADEWGYEPSNAEVVRELMKDFDESDL